MLLYIGKIGYFHQRILIQTTPNTTSTPNTEVTCSEKDRQNGTLTFYPIFVKRVTEKKIHIR